MLDIIKKRTSIRSYTGEGITDEELNQIIVSINSSPVGMKQYDNLKVFIITNKELLNKLEENTAKIFKKEGLRPLYGAPMLVLICSKKPEVGMENVYYSNAAIMSENIALTATELNIGCCHIWGLVSALNQNESLKKEINIPSNFIPCCGVTLGRTNQKYEEKDIPNRITINYLK